MKVDLLNAVILAEDHERLRDWYLETLELTLAGEWLEHYRYAELAGDGRIVVGIAPADQMGVSPGDRRNGTVVAQFRTDDIRRLLSRVEEAGGAVLFGPSHEEKEDFWYGGFADVEGNVCWVVEPPDLRS